MLRKKGEIMNIKKIIISLILLVSILVLCSCEEAKVPETPEPFEEKEFTKYDVYRDGEVFYIISDGRAYNLYENFNDFWTYDTFCISFDTYSELRTAVYQKGLTSFDMKSIYCRFIKHKKDGVITDGRVISELKYSPIVSDDISEISARMYGDAHYEINYSGEKSEKITWIYYPEASYKTLFDRYTSYFNDKDIVETTTTDDGSSTVYIYREKDSDTNKKLIRYTLQAEGKTFAVEEIYKKVDDTVPWELHMYSIDGEGYKVEIKNMTERPVKEWLLSFGIEEAPRDVYKNVIVVE